MFVPKKVIDIEITRPLDGLGDLEGYSQAHALVRLRGVPLGYVRLGTESSRPRKGSAMETILRHHSHSIIRALVEERLKAAPLRKKLRTEDLFLPPPGDNGPCPAPLVTVAVCTRDRASELEPCLESLFDMEYPALDIVVVDNAPATDATERLVRDRYPAARYFLEPRPGLDWARNRAILEARGEIVAFADDDVVADPGWVRALAAVFVENPDVMAVTGLVAPLELETEAQEIFENYNGFGKGFEYQWVRVPRGRPGEAARLHGGTGKFGTGANMAYRRRVFDEIGLFDPALDVGTVTNGGGDLEMFFRVIKEGHTLVYEPRAVVRHRHRREYHELRRQIHTWGIGYYSYLTRSFLAYPDERLRLALGPCMWWVAHVKRLARNLLKPTATKDLVLRELHGSLLGPFRYLKARARAEEIARSFGPQTDGGGAPRGKRPPREVRKDGDLRIAVRTVDVSRPIAPLEGLRGYDLVRVFVSLDGHPVGRVDLSDFDGSVSVSRLRHAIVKHLTFDLFDADGWPDVKFLSAHVYSEVARRFMALAEAPVRGARARWGSRRTPPSRSSWRRGIGPTISGAAWSR
jgi:GT2 family glycosyltransferase